MCLLSQEVKTRPQLTLAMSETNLYEIAQWQAVTTDACGAKAAQW